jgi:branched-chain amino acid transport system substrate-binding protein
MTKKGFLISAVALLFATGLLLSHGPGGFAQSSPPKTIKVGGAVSLTGKYAAGGVDVADGYRIAVKHINDAGGIMVKEYGEKIPLELLLYDDESDPSKTVTRLEKLYSVDNVPVYLGEFASDMNIAGLGIAEKNKVPWIGVTMAVENAFNQGFRYTFAPCMFSFMEVGSMFDALDTISKDKRPIKIANFELQVDWGKECTKYVNKLAAERGYKVVLEQKYAPDTKDFSSLILAAKAAGADVLFSVPTPPQSMAIIKQMKELDYAPKATCFIRGPDLSNYWQVMGKDANYILTCGEWTPDMPYPGNKKLVDDYKAQHPGKLIGMQVGTAYGAVQILADSITRAGKLDREAIRNAIAATDLKTVRGRVTFDKRGIGNVPWSLCQWQNGKLEVVRNPDFKTTPVLLAPPWGQR